MPVHRTIALLLVLGTVPMLAQGQQMDAEEIHALRTYCKSDVERLCPKVQMGDGRIKACLTAHKEQMSVGCAQALQKLKKAKK
jgi:Cysteine rich repeat